MKYQDRTAPTRAAVIPFPIHSDQHITHIQINPMAIQMLMEIVEARGLTCGPRLAMEAVILYTHRSIFGPSDVQINEYMNHRAGIDGKGVE